MPEVTGNWYWSTSDERFNSSCGPFETRDEALEAGRQEEPGIRIWTGQREDLFPMLDVQMDVLEPLGERAHSEVGEAVDDWPYLKKEVQEAMQKDLDALVKKYVPEPSWWAVRRQESHEPKEHADA